MKNNFFGKWLVLSALFVFMCFSPHGLLRAQSIANYTFSTSTSGTLEDLSTGSTSIMSAAVHDDDATTVNPIGFNFTYMGVSYSHFSTNSNGQFLLHTSAGATAISGSSTTPSAGTPLLFPMSGDNELVGGIRYKVIGSAPNRKFVLEWTQFYAYFIDITNAGNMQLWLNESNGQIDFVYGAIYNSNNLTINRSIGISAGTTATTQGSVTVGAAPTYTASATLTVNTFAAGSGTATASPLIANLGTLVEGTRRVYSFTPASIIAPTGLSFASVAATSMTLNWTDNATNEVGYRVYRSLDGITYTLATTLPANSNTYNATGLNINTLYYWKVAAYSEIESVLNGSQSTNPGTLAGGIKTVGSGGDYQNLTTAFADINAQGLTGNIELQLITGYPAAPETYPILSCNAAVTGAFTVKVYPTVSGLSITSANTTGTLNLNGAANVTFDGRVNQTGAADLVISNTNAGASYAVQFVNDAKTNTLQYLTIHSANNSTSSGTIVFAGSTGTTGNDNNIIAYCDIKDGATTPLNGIYSAGASTTVDNSGNIVSNSNIFNYFGAATASNGILLSSNSAAWTINANKFYQTATRTLTGGSQHRGINIITSSGSGYIITNNVIGYASSTATGVTTYTASAGRFFGIELTASNTGTASSIQGNTISGISLTSTSGTTAAPGIFAGISILSGTVNVGNTTPNIIGAATGNGAITVSNSTSASIFGIHANSTGTLNISNNVIGAINGAGSAAAIVCNMTAINNTGSSTSTTISGNTIGGATSNSIAIGTLGTSTGSGTFSGISSTGSHTTFTASGNTINNVANYHNNTGSFLNGVISSSGTPTTMVVNNNTVSNLLLAAGNLSGINAGGSTTLTANGNSIFNASVTGASGTIYGIQAGITQFTFNNNIIRDLSFTANSGTASSNVYGIYDLSSPTAENITNNQIYNLSVAGATTSTSNVVAGINTNTTGSSVKNFSGNVINGLSFTNSSTGTVTMNGISSASGATISIFKNKIYNLSASGATSIVNGIVMTSGATGNVYNNVIGDLKAPIASAADAIRGISINSTATATYRVYYNSVYLNASSTGTNFGTSGIYHAGSATATTAVLDLRNNIVINESTPSGTGITAAFRRTTGLANFASTSNRNLFYAGTPSATRLIMYDGTTSYQTIASYQAAVLPREANSFTGEAAFTGVGYGTAGNFFISTTPANANYLKPVAGVSTQVESGAVNITTPSITDDYAGIIRQGNGGYTGTGTAPDLGAFEFNGTQVTPVITLNSVTPPATTQCVAAARLVSVDITTTAGTITGATIGYTVNGVAQTNIVMTNVSGNTWTGTIPVPTPANAVITWGVAAQNSLGLNSSYTGTSYSDEPLTGITASVNASSTTVCAGSPSTLTAVLATNGAATIGTATTLTGATVQPTAFCNRWSSYRMQTIYTAAELTAGGLTAGPITSMSFNITTLGDAATNANFVVKIGTTGLTAFTDFVATTGYTTVFPAATYTHAVGVNVINFSTPYIWDGTSNIVIEVSHDGANASNNAQTYYTATAGNTVAWSTNGGATGTLSTNRLNVTLTGKAIPAIQSISWSDGVATVGTTNPLSVSPSATTTYTATVTALGCTFTPSPTRTITVNPLPAMPTATNSAQCGVQVPTASVASTSGLPTPTFKWYSAPSGGTVMQNSTSTTYTSTVSATTTFYVSELNSVTGCESPRVAVTVTVSTPDQVSLTASVPSICLGGTFTLTAANINGTPLQNYTYATQSVATGSGAETPIAGSPISVTPTAAGTYTYTLTATDGGCAASATATVLVNSLPAITSATATPATVCSSDQITLTGASVSVSTGTTPIGTQTATDLGSGVYRYGFGTGDFRHQLVFTAAELNAAGLVAGNITSIAFNVTSVGSGAGNNYTIKMGNTSATAVTTTFLTDPTSTVYNTASYTAVSGLNTHTFATPFNWNGTSNILIEICYNVAVTGGSSTLAVNTPASARNASLLGAANACTVATGTTFALRPIVTFGGQVGTNLASSLNWVWTPGTGLNTPIATTSITNTTGSAINQVFTVTATNPTTGCSSVATTSPVTINAAPVTPVANNATQCGIGTPTISVTGSGTPGNTFSWYPTAVGGTAISGQTGSSLTAYPISATTTFYVSESNGTCSSARTAVTATVTAPPAISVSGTTTICNGSSTALTASSANDPNYTYTWSGGLGTGATVNASPTANTTYTVTATDASGGANNGCVNTATYSIVVNPIPSAVVAGVNDASICNGESVNLTSSATSNSQNVPATVLTQNFNSGLGAWTTTATGTAPAAAGFVLQNPPYSYTTYFSNFSTPNGGGFAMSNADLTGSGNKIRTTLVSPSFSTVGMASANLTFENLYRKWNSGDSLARVEISTNGGTSWSALKDYMALGSQGVVTDNAQVPANESISLASYLNQANLKIRFNYVTTYGYYWAVDNIVVSGLQPAAATYSWASSPAGFTSSVQNPTGVAPTVSTTYTVTATNSYGCSASGSVAVTVNQPTSSSVSATACDTYTWAQNGATYTTSGTHTAVIPNAAGCDSTITLNLTINNSTSATVPVTSCDTYTWPINGTTYTTSGTHTATIMNAAGCDSVITLNLTINHSTAATVNQVACQTYTWPVNGTTYTTSGTYTATIMNAAGCDSVITLNLTIGGPSASSVSVTECSSYTWAQNGMMYTASGAYTDTIMNMYGCDSVITLNLTINQPTTSTVTETECTSYTWAQNGMTYTASGMYNDTIANAAGCDSIITLDLTIIQPTVSSVSVTECSSYTWAQNGMTYIASGMYTDTIPNGVGCDSIITLNLTINTPTSSVFTVSTCSPSYTWAQNGTVYNASGMYNDTIPNAAGCDSVVTLNLTITNFVATATDNGNATITASAGTTYQWVNCTTNTPIAGATAQTFAATANGSYAVIVSNGTCSDTSNCVNITNVGIKENTISTISVHPNPTHDIVIVTMDAASAIVEVMDVQGKLVQTTQIKSGDQVDLSAYERGVYTLRIKTELGTSIERIVKN